MRLRLSTEDRFLGMRGSWGDNEIVSKRKCNVNFSKTWSSNNQSWQLHVHP